MDDLEALERHVDPQTSKASLRRTMCHHFVSLMISGRMSAMEAYGFVRNLFCPPPEFESWFATTGLKFQLVYILILALGVGSLEIYAFKNSISDDGLFIPGAIVVTVRTMALMLGTCWKQSPIMKVGVALVVMDSFMIYSWCPHGLWARWSLSRTVAASPTQVCQFHNAQSMLGATHLSIWFNTLFVLTFRWSVVGLAGCAIMMGFMNRVFDDGTQSSFMAGLRILFNVVFALCVKVHVELLQRALHKTLEEKTQEALKEKVLRFQAEYAREQIQTQLHGSEGEAGSECLNFREAPQPQAESSRRKAAPQTPSLHSAPPVLLPLLADASVFLQDHREEDCLPPDAHVWVEGSVLPCKVQEVKPEQSVLCYDNLSRCMKYSQVSAVKTIAGEADWVNVKLADGTSLTMTANHPVQREELGDQNRRRSQALVKAGDLHPGEDAVTILRMVPVPVVQVTPCTAMARETRVALSVRQPARHSVFVASKGDTMAGTMAVGSANCNYTKRPHDEGTLPMKWTFLHIEDADGKPRRRTHSAPPSLSARSGHSDLEEGTRTSPKPRRLPRPLSCSDLSSERSSDDPHELPLVLWTREDFTSSASASTTLSNCVAMSDLMSVRSKGILSVGSDLHASKDCRPCVFQNKFLHYGMQPCFRGELCERCHHPHDFVDFRPKRKSGALRRWEKKALVRQPSTNCLASL